MKYAELGSSGLKVSRICLGTVFRSEQDEASCLEAIQQAAELGCNYLDGANVYRDGFSEKIIGKAIRGCRDQFIVSTKVGSPEKGITTSGGLSRGEIMRAVEASLQRLDTDYLDTYLCHFPDPDTPLSETLRAMDDLVQQGKIRHVGVSRFEGWRLAESLFFCELEKISPPVCHQLCYSLLDRCIEEEVLPYCHSKSIAVTVFATTAIGLLSGRYRYGQPPPRDTSWYRGPYNYRTAMTQHVDQVIQAVMEIATVHEKTPSQIAMAWCLAQPGITSVITGADTAQRVRENCAAIDICLSPEELKYLCQIAEGQRLVIHKDCPQGYTRMAKDSGQKD